MIESLLDAMKWLLGLLVKSHAVSRAQSREHDITVFKRADATVNETMMKNLLNHDLYNHWCWLVDIRAVSHFCADSRLEENQFLDAKVRRAAQRAVEALSKVDSFVAEYFYVSAVNDKQMLQLHPHLREADDEGRRTRYKQYVAELDALATAAWTAYRTFRATVRDRLKV